MESPVSRIPDVDAGPAKGVLIYEDRTSGIGIMTEEMTVLLAKEGHETAFRELYERHQEDIYRLAYRYTCSAQDAEDVLQETFIKAFQGIRAFDLSRNSSFAAWVNRLCVYRCLDHLRKEKRRRTHQIISLNECPDELKAAGPSPECSAEAGQLVQKIQQALTRLSPKQRIIFDMRYCQHHDIRDIADTFGCSESAVKTHLSRAREKLRDALAPIVEEL